MPSPLGIPVVSPPAAASASLAFESRLERRTRGRDVEVYNVPFSLTKRAEAAPSSEAKPTGCYNGETQRENHNGENDAN